MTPEVFALWAPDAPLDEVLQVCFEDRLAADPVVRVLVEILGRVNEEREQELAELNGRLNEAFVVGASTLASDVEQYIEEIGGNTPVADVRGAIEGLADVLCAGEYASDDLTLDALSNEDANRIKRVRAAMRSTKHVQAAPLRGIYQTEVLSILRANPRPMKRADVVQEVARRLRKSGTAAIYTAISALISKRFVEEPEYGWLCITPDA